MIKKLISSLVALTMMFSVILSASAAIEFTLGYTPGDTHLAIDAADIIATDNATVTSDGVKINAGGSATYGFYLPYASRSVSLNYTGQGKITVATNDNVYTAVLPDGGAYLLEFGANLGIEPQFYKYNVGDTAGYWRDYVEHSGEKEVKITSDSALTISGLSFEKELTPAPDSRQIPNVSSAVLNTVNTVFVDTKAPIIVANGGKRYIDNDNITMLPYNYNGSVYLPINTLAKALGYYHEDIPEKGYAMMRSETHEVVLMEDKCTVSKGLNTAQPTSVEAIIYRDGQTLAAVRYFAELMGKTVGFQNGLIVIDDKYTVKDILGTKSYLDYATEKFAPFKEQRKTGSTYYVAQTSSASDGNSGTVFAPFKTLAKASEVAKAGDTVIIREGVYREVLAPKNSGTATAPITFKAAEGENVVISANDVLGKAAQYEGDVYITNMPIDLGDGRNQIFINGEMQTEARYPNGPDLLHEEGKLSDAWPLRGNLYRPVCTQSDEAYNYINSDTLLNQEDNYWEGGTFVGLFGLAYAVMSAKITASTKGQLTLDENNRTDRKHWWVQKESHNVYNYGYIVGHENALDIPGEWIRTSEGVLKIILPKDVNPDNVQIEAKARQLVIDTTNKNFINFEGIKTIGGSALLKNSEMCMLKNMDMKYITHYTVSADQRDGYIDFPFNRTKEGAPQRGEVGMFISGTDNILINSTIDHSAGAAVYLVGTYTYIENNVISDCGYMGSYVAGIQMNTQAWDSATKARGGHAIFNNTIRNVGRAAINIESVEATGHSGAPYLPMEIAYNNVNSAMLTSADTGMIYTYGVNVGTDRRRTQLHHNYVYTTAIKEDASYYAHGIYWDGLSQGSDTYQNILFHTGKGAPFYKAPVIQQLTSDTVEAYHRMWENHTLGYVDEDINNLKNAYFSEERPFYAGSYLENAAYENNYERFKQASFRMQNVVANATLSDGITVNAETGYASFSGNGQIIDFGEVDFGERSNELAIAVRGDNSYTYDQIEIAIDNDWENSFKATVAINSPGLEQTHTKRIVLPDLNGKHNVKIKMLDYRSAKIGGISIYCHKAEFENDDVAHFAYAGAYSARKNIETGEDATTFAEFQIDTSSYNPAAPALKSTWPGNYLRYDNQVIKEAATHMVFSIGSRAQYRKQIIKVYLDSLNSEPIGEFRVLNKQFYDYTPAAIELNKKVEAGTYDIYLVFEDDTPEESSSSNFLYFGFLKEGADLSEYKVKVREYGMYFDETLSVQNEQRPFHSLFINAAPFYYQKGILYTLPGTVAAHTDVDIPAGCTHFYIDYAATAEYAGQPVEVRLGSLDSEPIASFVTEAHTFEAGEPKAIELSREIAAGNYTVYLSFGGNNPDQTMQLNWFGFGVE